MKGVLRSVEWCMSEASCDGKVIMLPSCPGDWAWTETSDCVGCSTPGVTD